MKEDFKYCIRGGETTVWYGQKSLNFFGKIHYLGIVLRSYFKIWKFYLNTRRVKECFYGPFKGEFGHFLLHNLPFLSHLHERGIKIHYCGMELHRPFLVNNEGESIIFKYYPLRDFFSEKAPSMNCVLPPDDVQKEIDTFVETAQAARLPFLNLLDHNMYWFVFRNWQLNGRQFKYNLDQVYKSSAEHSAVIFPRKKGAVFTLNNGGAWDYQEIASSLKPFFDKIYITGHPSMSANLREDEKIIVCLSADNSVILEKCSNASLILSQHSGAIHLGSYTNTNVLLIFNGTPPILGLSDSLRFRKNIDQRPLNYAFNIDEIREKSAEISKEKSKRNFASLK